MSTRPLIIALSAVSVSLLAAGCGGGKSPGVANRAGSAAGTTTATTQSQSAPPVKGLVAFSSCMRKHGIANFPDPNSQGVIGISSGMGIDPGSPRFQSARTACAKLLPNGGRPTPAQIAQQQKEMLQFSICMRSHGIKDFPDPSNGGLTIRARSGSDLDPNNPTFQKAQQACQKYLPFKGGTVKGG